MHVVFFCILHVVLGQGSTERQSRSSQLNAVSYQIFSGIFQMYNIGKEEDKTERNVVLRRGLDFMW